MKIYVYSVYDVACKAYGTPFFLQADGAAIRTFQDAINNRSQDGRLTNLNSHPDQFTLFKIGEYDDHTGQVISFTPVSLGNGTTYVTEAFNKDKLELMIERLSEHLISDYKELLSRLNDINGGAE